jgi:YgiT-type zinc finger domain-containing protein
MDLLTIRRCPTCGSDKIKKICKDWQSTAPGENYTITSLEFYECPDCGEELYDREAMRKIEAKFFNMKARTSKRIHSNKKHDYNKQVEPVS